MLLKLKICATVWTLYEIIAVMLLHCPRTCQAMFGMNFCEDHVFKYFIACFAIPALIGLIVMWIMEIIHGAHRRHTLMYKARTAFHDIASNVGERLSETVSSKDLEKIIVAAVMAGIKHYSDNHPKMRERFDNVMNGGKWDNDAGDMYPDNEDYEESDTRATRRVVRPTASSSSNRTSNGGTSRNRK